METSMKQRCFFVIITLNMRRKKATEEWRRLGLGPKALGLSPSSATSLAVILGEWCEVGAMPIRHRAAISITRDKYVKAPGT